MAKSRSIEERKSLNYYKLLGLEESATDVQIEKALSEKTKNWQAKNNQKLLELREDIRRVMLTDKRAKEEELRTFKVLQEEERRGIVGSIRKFLAHGVIDSIQFEEILKLNQKANDPQSVIEVFKREGTKFIDFNKAFGVKKLDRILKVIEVHESINREEVLIKETFAKASGAQAPKNFRSLYDFLNITYQKRLIITRNSTIEEMKVKMGDILALVEAKDRAHNKVEWITIDGIRGKIEGILDTELMSFYAGFYPVLTLFTEIQKIGYYNQKEYEKQLAQAVSTGISQPKAEVFLRYAYSANKIHIESRDKINYRVCNSCQNVYNADKYKDNCPYCGENLKWVCEVCKTPNSSDGKCVKCGINPVRYKNYKVDLEATKIFLDSRDFASAKVKINELKEYVEIIDYFKKVYKKDEIADLNAIISVELDYNNSLKLFDKNVFDAVRAKEQIDKFILKYTKYSETNSSIKGKIEHLKALYLEWKNATVCTCGELLKGSGVRVCPKCKRQIYEVCWNCKKERNTLKQIICDCGATSQNKEEFFNDFEEVSALIHGGVTIERANNELNLLKAKYKDINETGTEVFKSISSLDLIVRKQTESVKEERQKSLSDIEKAKILFLEKKVYGAYSIIESLVKLNPTFQNDLVVRSVIEKYSETVEKIKEATKAIQSKDDEHFVKLCNEIALVCVDSEELKELIYNNPPKPVTYLKSRIEGSMIYLEFEASKSFGVTYTVIRKAKIAPMDVFDGEVIYSSGASTRVKSATQIASESYFYKVYTKRFDIYSKAVEIGPITTYPNVSDITQEHAERRIKVSWKAPVNVSKIEVWKKEGEVPTRLGDGQSIFLNGFGGFEDMEVLAGKKYGYYIECVYDSLAKTNRSEPITITFTPSFSPSNVEITDVIKRGGLRYDIKYHEPMNGTQMLYVSKTKIDVPKDKIMLEADMHELFPALREFTIIGREKGNMAIELLKNEIYYLYPAVRLYNSVTFGERLTINTTPGVKNVTCEIVSNRIYVNFDWEEETTRAILIANKFKHYEAYDSSAMPIYVEKKSGEKSSQVFVDNVTASKWYLTLFACIKDGEKEELSEPICIPIVEIKNPANVYYEVSKKGNKLFFDFTTSEALTLNDVEFIRIDKSKDEIEIIATTPRLVFKKILFKNKYKCDCFVKSPYKKDQTNKTYEVRLIGQSKIALYKTRGV